MAITHYLLKWGGKNCNTSTYKTFGIHFDVCHSANTHAYYHNHNGRFDLSWVLLTMKDPFQNADHRNHTQFWNLRQKYRQLTIFRREICLTWLKRDQTARLNSMLYWLFLIHLIELHTPKILPKRVTVGKQIDLIWKI